MCGRYSLHAHPDVVALQFGLDSIPEFQARYNIAPATDVLCIRKNLATFARWGLRGKFVNLRAETAASKFRRSGRCLVPASGFYEWKSEGGRKQPYYFFPASDALLGFAALWERDTCTLITTEASGEVRKVHDRMPLIVARESYAAWLAGAEGLPPQAALECHPVS
ncbi:MAG: SOS response-associated peptidase, partial [Burkholderiales bacterium]